jgi:LmbE family N-acetylglucosaminyl deacetylase
MGRRINKILAPVVGVITLVVAAVSPMIVHAVADCSAGKSMNIVAHQDDDILFLNPDIQHDIDNSYCVETIYMTAGNGQDTGDFMERRENGAKAAYATMAGEDNDWTDSTRTLLGNVIKVSTLDDQPEITLVFLRLPDGGDGGYYTNNYETMKKLWTNVIGTNSAVDESAIYTRQELIDVLALSMAVYAPTTVRTLDYEASYSNDDHDDHNTAAYFAREAHRASSLVSHSFVGYQAYPKSSEDENVFGSDLTASQNTYFAYNAVVNAAEPPQNKCISLSQCNAPGYLAWLERLYTVDSEAGNPSWSYTTLDGVSGSSGQLSGDIGYHPATAEFGGSSYVFYFDAASGDLRVGKNSSSTSPSWAFTTLDGAGGSNGRVSASVGLLPAAKVFDSKLHVFYYDESNGNLRHGVTSDGTNWSFSDHDGSSTASGRVNANVGTYAALSVYNTNSLQLFYYDETNGNLRHSWSSDGVNWLYENLDGAGSGSVINYTADVGKNVSVTEYGSALHLFYYDATAQDLRHLWVDSSGWHPAESLDGSGGTNGRVSANVGLYSSTVVQGDVLHVFYSDQTNGNLRHMYTSSTVGWQAETLTGDSGAVIRFDANTGSMPSAIVHGSSLEVYAYDTTNNNLVRLWHNGTAWQEEQVDGAGDTAVGGVNANTGYDAALMNFGAKLYVFYYDSTNGNLRLMTK